MLPIGNQLTAAQPGALPKRSLMRLPRALGPPIPAHRWWLVLGFSRTHVVFITCLLLAAVWDFTAFFCCSAA